MTALECALAILSSSPLGSYAMAMPPLAIKGRKGGSSGRNRGDVSFLKDGVPFEMFLCALESRANHGRNNDRPQASPANRNSNPQQTI